MDPDELQECPEGVYVLGSRVLKTTCLGRGDPKKVDPAHSIPVVPAGCDKPAQAGPRLMGIACRSAWSCRTCRCNWHNAMCNRHAARYPESRYNPLQGGAEPSLVYALAVCRPVTDLAAFEYDTEAMIEIEERWLEKWPERKRVAILLSRRDELPAFSRLKCMVKFEVCHKRPKKARGIQFYTNFATQSALGPVVSRLQKTAVRVFNSLPISTPFGVSTVTIASGLTSRLLGEWMETALMDGAKLFYERDGANWDATMHPGLQEACLEFYSRVLPAGERWILERIRDGISCHGSYRDGYGQQHRYRVNGTRKSGHNDTSLGNSIINAFLALEALASTGARGHIIVVGDDLLIASPDDLDGELMAQREREYGITPEYAVFSDWRDVTFISGCWAPSLDGLRFVPLPGRLLARLAYTTKRWAEDDVPAWWWTVASGLKPALQGFPLVWAYIMCQPGAEGKDGERTLKLDNEMKHKFEQYSSVNRWGDEATQWFCDRYRMTRKDIAVLETMFTNMKGLKEPTLVKHALIDRIIDRDTSDVVDREVVGAPRSPCGAQH